MENKIINRVEKSGLIQINLDDFYPEVERVIFDLKNCLKEGFILIEKDFRAFVNTNDWSIYQDKYVGIVCSNDAIIPMWAFMLVALNIKPFAKKVMIGNEIDLEKEIFNTIISELDFTVYKDKNVIVKGCGKRKIPISVVVDFTLKLQPFAKSIMFGEACSAVPLFKRK